MRRKHFKALLSILLCTTMVLSCLSGCSLLRSSKEDPLADDPDLILRNVAYQAYYAPLTEADIETKGNLSYAASRLLLVAAANAEYADIQDLVSEEGGEIVGYISVTGDYQIHFPDGKSFSQLEKLASKWQRHDLVREVSLEYAAPLSNDSVNYTGDPWRNDDAPSDTSGSTWDESVPAGNNWWAEAIDMPQVWEEDLNLQPVKVGIIDSMFDTSHQDFKSNTFVKLWNNPVDKNGKCRVPEIYLQRKQELANAKASGDDAQIKDADSLFGNAFHGTHVAGIIAAHAGNGTGITGINPNVSLYAYARLSDESSSSIEMQWGSAFTFKYELAALLNNGVKVINISMGYSKHLEDAQGGDSDAKKFLNKTSYTLEAFLYRYINAGVDFLIVKSAGNEHGCDATYDVFGAIASKKVADRILMVGAANYLPMPDWYVRASFSNAGDRVDLYAPGVNILSLVPSNCSTFKDGTSMATPIVTGVVSLIWGINPDLSPEQVRDILKASTSTTSHQLDDAGIIDELIGELLSDPVPIINAKMCVDLARNTKGTMAEPQTTETLATLSGNVFAKSGDSYATIEIEELALYDLDGNPLRDLYQQVSTLKNVYEFTELVEPGSYLVKAKIVGHMSQVKKVTLCAGDVTVVNFDFSASPSASNNAPYEELLDMFSSNLSNGWADLDGDGWDDVYDPDNVSYVLSWMNIDLGPSEVGYALLDLDGNGQDELLIADVYNAEGGCFHDLYTVYNGNVVHLASGGERDLYSLAQNNTINNSGSSGAASSITANYRVDAATGKLTVNKAIISEESYHFLAERDFIDPNTYEYHYEYMTSISLQEARKLLKEMPANASLDLILFSEYKSTPVGPRDEPSSGILTEEEAYDIACDYWNYTEGDVSPQTGFELFVHLEYETLQTDETTGTPYYSFMLRWLVTDENGRQYMSTCDIIHVNAITGECTYF